MGWIRQLLPVNLPLAARVAIDHQQQLEPDGAYPGGGRCGPNGVLQLLRHVLLLTQSDAGAAVKKRIRISGVLGILEAPVLNLAPDDPLQHWWAERLRAAFAREIDLRQRIEAGFLLGELGDNLRYELVTATAPEGDMRIGLCLKAELWASFGQPGRKQRFVVGGSRWDREADDDEKPARAVRLDAFAMARLPVTVAEWRWFAQAGYVDAQAPWWRQVGPAAQRWLTDQKRLDFGGSNWSLAADEFGQLSQPMMQLTAYEALAYAHWSAPLYRQAAGDTPDLANVRTDWPVQLPSEDLWEGGMRGPARWFEPWLRPARPWPFPQAGASPHALAFNHEATKLKRPAPVGCFALGASVQGVFDGCGQVWEWCGSRFTGPATAAGSVEDPEEGSKADAIAETDRIGLRGGTFDDDATFCRPSFRGFDRPNGLYWATGMRLVRIKQPQSEP